MAAVRDHAAGAGGDAVLDVLHLPDRLNRPRADALEEVGRQREGHAVADMALGAAPGRRVPHGSIEDGRVDAAVGATDAVAVLGADLQFDFRVVLTPSRGAVTDPIAQAR